MIRDHMKPNAVTVSPTTTVREAARLVVSRHVGTLPVVDEDRRLMGVVRLEDLLRLFMPDFVALMDDIDFVRDFGALESMQPREMPGVGELTMKEVMGAPFSVEGTCGPLRAFAAMAKHQARDLPVVDDQKRLIGIASRVDIAVAFLAPWAEAEETP